MAQHNEQEYIKHLCDDVFPFQFDDKTILYLDDVKYLDGKRKYQVNIHDNYGYKFRTISNQIIARQKQKSYFKKFFGGNPFTLENINTFLTEINSPLKLMCLSEVDNALSKLGFINVDTNEMDYVCWNDIQSDPIKYTRENYGYYKMRRESHNLTKYEIITIIRNKEIELGRPLLQSDFEGVVTSSRSVGIRVIWRIWGTFNNMIDELGLLKHDTYFKPNSLNYIPHSEYMNIIKSVCEKVKSDGRNIVTCSDFKNIGVGIERVKRHCKKDGVTLSEKIAEYGCQMQKSGCGMEYTFCDGETVKSKYEYDFSVFLRNNGFIFNQTYFRDIRYDHIDKIYKGNMNCDYKIILNGTDIYVELAGILQNTSHIEAYFNNIPINSKSKEVYRQKLNKKKEILERNKLKYYILFRTEMNDNTYRKIIL